MSQTISRTRRCTKRLCVSQRPHFFLIPDCFKNQEMCIKTVKVDPWQLENVPDHFNTQKLCDDAVSEDPYSLEYIPDWFVMQEQVN